MRKVMICSVVASSLTVCFSLLPFVSACADALPVTDVATVTNSLVRSYSDQRGTSNANVRVLTVDEAVASVDKVFAKAPSGNFSSDRLAEKLYAERNALFIQRHYNPAFPVMSILEDLSR